LQLLMATDLERAKEQLQLMARDLDSDLERAK
jgi:hypothetical protein